ncbi:MAG: hypothetical protein AVDCRST_MAG30-2145, partial [uncultured Solirubrobacteraceae bacterium]
WLPERPGPPDLVVAANPVVAISRDRRSRLRTKRPRHAH